MKELAQGTIDKWEMVPSWNFISSSIDLNSFPNDPWRVLNNRDENISIIHIPNLNKDHTSTNFIGYKYGDVNNTVSP